MNKLLKVFIGIVLIAVVLLAGFALITSTSGKIAPYLLLLMGLMATLMGITQYAKQKFVSLGLFLAASFAVFVGIYIF